MHTPDAQFQGDDAFVSKKLVNQVAIGAFSERYVQTVTKEALNLPRLHVEAVYYDIEFPQDSVNAYLVRGECDMSFSPEQNLTLL